MVFEMLYGVTNAPSNFKLTGRTVAVKKGEDPKPKPRLVMTAFSNHCTYARLLCFI